MSLLFEHERMAQCKMVAKEKGFAFFSVRPVPFTRHLVDKLLREGDIDLYQAEDGFLVD